MNVAKRVFGSLLLIGVLFSLKPAFSGALITSSVTGKVWAVNRYHGRIVRFTIRDNGWPNALHDIVIRPSTHIFHQGYGRERLSANVLYKGEQVRAQGGVTTFGDRIVADRIILLSR